MVGITGMRIKNVCVHRNLKPDPSGLWLVAIPAAISWALQGREEPDPSGLWLVAIPAAISWALQGREDVISY